MRGAPVAGIGRRAVLTYDDFEPGSSLGQATFTLDEVALDRWRRLFPADDRQGVMPHGMLAVLSMRAFFKVVPDRPPGNIHAAQRFDLARLPRSGETLTTRVFCVAKEIRRERKRVTFGTETLGPHGPAFTSRMTILWAK